MATNSYRKLPLWDKVNHVANEMLLQVEQIERDATFLGGNVPLGTVAEELDHWRRKLVTILNGGVG